MGIVSENIEKYYSNPMCSQCDYFICKVYGGRCKKYQRKQRWDKFIGLFKRRRKQLEKYYLKQS